MSEDELERRLREELRRRLVPGEPSYRIYGHVAQLGRGEALQPMAARGRLRRLHQRAGILGGLAAAAGISAIIVASLFWRSGQTPTASSSPSNLAWDGSDVNAWSFGRLDAEFGWVVGAPLNQPQALYVTADGGTTWDRRQLPYSMDDEGSNIVFTDRDHVFVAATTGQDGAFTDAVLRSSDGGRTWTRAVVSEKSPFSIVPTSLDMLDGQRGWLVLRRYAAPPWLFELWGTTDGGTTWSPLVGGSDTAPNQVQFTSPDEGWASSLTTADQILHSTDGGRTWAVVPLPVPVGYDVQHREIRPRGSNGKLVLHGLAAPAAGPSGFGTASNAWVTWTSTDGGADWYVDSVETGAGQPVTDGMRDRVGYGLVGYLDSKQSLVLTEPGGRTATFGTSSIDRVALSGRAGSVTSAVSFSGTEAWITVELCQPTGPGFPSGGGLTTPCYRLLGTSDGGNTWQPLLRQPAGSSQSPTVPPCCTMNPVGERQRTREPLTDWLDATHGWAVVGTSLYWTADGGQIWGGVYSLPASGTIQFIDSQHGWLTASGSSDPGGPIYADPVYRTADGGRTWTATDLPAVTEASWTWSHFTDARHGIVAQCPQLIAGQSEVECRAFTTDDGGVTFQGPTNTTFATPITWLSPAVGYGVSSGAGGSAGATLRLTSDGGRSWTSQKLEALPDGTACSAVPLAMELTPGGNGRLLVRCQESSGPNVLAHYETTDGGQIWHVTWHFPEATDQFMLAVRVAGADLVGLTETTFWVSKDFGVTWAKFDVAPTDIHDFAFLDARTGWLVRAPTYSSSPDALLGTSAANAHWHAVLQDRSVITNP